MNKIIYFLAFHLKNIYVFEKYLNYLNISYFITGHVHNPCALLVDSCYQHFKGRVERYMSSKNLYSLTPHY